MHAVATRRPWHHPIMADESNRHRQDLGSAIAIGLVIGAAIGLAMDNLGLGVGIGLAVGVVIGAVIQNRRR